MTTEQLWSDERIVNEVDDALWEADSELRERARRLLRRCVADAETELARLRGELAEAKLELTGVWHTLNTQAEYIDLLEAEQTGRWQPVEDDFNFVNITFEGRHTERIGVKGDWLTVGWRPESGEEYKASVQLPNDLCLCKRTSGVVAAMEPDWSKAPEWARWWAVDADGSPYWFEEKPEQHLVTWQAASGQYEDSDREPNADWRTTLQQRLVPPADAGGEVQP